MSEQQNIGTNKRPIQEGEIDLIELAKVIWSRKWFIAKVTSIFVVLGLVIAFTSPKEYETSCTLIPEAVNQSGKLGGSLGGLASLAGVDISNLSNGNQTIDPALYQSVSRSTPFLLKLMQQEFYFSEMGENITIYDFYIKHMDVSLIGWVRSVPSRLKRLIKTEASFSFHSNEAKSDSSLLFLSKYENIIIEDLKTRVFVEMDWDLNLLTIEVEMQDPLVAAQMASFTMNYITDYVTKYSISKSKSQLGSIEKQYLQQKEEFKLAQYRLAAFRDKNQNVTTARAQSEEERLRSEYNLAFNVYNQLAQQKEAIKLKVEENTPVFTVLEPVKIPVEKTKPKRLVILIALIFVGIVLSIFFIVINSLRKFL